MAITALPTQAETFAAIPTSAGVTTPSSGMFATQQASALSWLEDFTGSDTVVASTTASVRHFDGFMPSSEGYVLKLDCAIPYGQTAIIKTGWEASDGTTGASWTNPLVVADDYEYREYNGRPYRSILFHGSPGSGRKSIAISAKWGLCLSTDILPDVFLAILFMGASMMVQQSSADTGPMTRAKAGEVEMSWSDAKGHGRNIADELAAKAIGYAQGLCIN